MLCIPECWIRINVWNFKETDLGFSKCNGLSWNPTTRFYLWDSMSLMIKLIISSNYFDTCHIYITILAIKWSKLHIQTISKFKIYLPWLFFLRTNLKFLIIIIGTISKSTNFFLIIYKVKDIAVYLLWVNIDLVSKYQHK